MSDEILAEKWFRFVECEPGSYMGATAQSPSERAWVMLNEIARESIADMVCHKIGVHQERGFVEISIEPEFSELDRVTRELTINETKALIESLKESIALLERQGYI